MIKRFAFTITLFFLISISALSTVASAYWIWTPETKKFTNPKYAVKDSPKEQFDWGMSFYNAKDFQRAATEFEKLAKQYEFSEYASKAQYYVGLCYENMNKYYLAYQNYQKAIDNFPHIANTEEILAREFAIGNLYLSKPGPKILGTDIMAPLDRAVEIFKKVVENAPYGKFAEEAQFNLGEALKKSERYEEAVQAFHKIVEDYPKSKFATRAMYQESQCAYKASLRPAYDAEATDNAIKTFEKFVYKNKDTEMAQKAETTMKRLKDKVSEKSFRAAEFYESQGKTQAAIIYYQDVIDSYPESSFINRAQAKIEALKAKGTKKAAPVVDLTKKKSKQVAREKKSWNPFSFKSGEKKVKTAAPEAPKKKSWNPFSFKSEKKQAQTVAQPTPTEEAAPKKNPWNLFNLGVKKEPVAKEAAAKEAPKKRAWNPLSFDTAKKIQPDKAPETSVVVERSSALIEEEGPAVPIVESPVAIPTPQIIEAPEAEPTAQLIEAEVAETPETGALEAEVYVSESTLEESHTPELPAEEKDQPAGQAGAELTETTLSETPKAKSWKPLNFNSKKEPVIDGTDKNKGWKPLYFGTNDEPMAATNRRW